MKKIKKIGLSKIRIILCLCFLLISAILLEFFKMQNDGKDITAPVLRVDGNSPVYQADADLGELIVGVTAEDDVDGDVSDTIRVRSIYLAEGSDEATVTYVAKDRSNNVGTIRRSVHVDRSQTNETGMAEESETVEENPAGQ